MDDKCLCGTIEQDVARLEVAVEAIRNDLVAIVGRLAALERRVLELKRANKRDPMEKLFGKEACR